MALAPGQLSFCQHRSPYKPKREQHTRMISASSNTPLLVTSGTSLTLLIRRPVQQRLKQIRPLIRHTRTQPNPQRQPWRLSLAGILLRPARHSRRDERVSRLCDVDVVFGRSQREHIAEVPVVVHGGGAQRQGQGQEGGGNMHIQDLS